MNDEHATAYHEAGHAVAYLVRSISIVKVTIDPTENEEGLIMSGHVEPVDVTISADDCSVISYSGPAAEKEFFGRYVTDVSHDLLSPRKRFERADDFFTEMENRARLLIRENRKAVEKLAGRLLADRCLSGEKVESLLGQIIIRRGEDPAE